MRRKKGLSLVEIILSIAVLSIFSVFILEMFLTARTINIKARNLDESVVNTEIIVQALRANNGLETLMKSDGLQEARWGDAPLMTLAWDENWQIVSLDEDVAFKLLMFSSETLEGPIELKMYQLFKDEELLIYEIKTYLSAR